MVASDSAPKAGRRIVMWNPPVIDERTQRRRSTLSEGAELLADLVAEGMRTICFLRSRKGIELIQRFARLRLEERGREDLAARIAPYRAGYTPQQRREIEHRLVSGDLLGVVATDALELGIDIGELDASICVTFPGTVASLRQMWGRAGRRTEGLAVYVAGEDALDQFFCRHPDEFLGRAVEAAILDHENPHIQTGHILAAAHEAPLGGGPSQPGGEDDAILGAGWRERADDLVAAGELRQAGDGRYVPRDKGFVAGRISLRSASLDSVAVVDSCSGEMLGSVEAERAFSTIHPGAIYLHLGRSYEVRELDTESRRAIVDPFDGDWYTQPKKETNVYIDAIGRKAEAEGIHRGVELYTGEVSVSEQVIAYQRKTVKDQEVIDLVALNLPEQSFTTRALWYVLPDELAGPEALPPDVQLGALHAAEHSQIAVLPLLGDVRPLGHRRSLDERPLPDRAADDLHLRRPPGRRRDRRARVRALSESWSETRCDWSPSARASGMPLLRPEPEVRQPERAAPQGGRDRADGRDPRQASDSGAGFTVNSPVRLRWLPSHGPGADTRASRIGGGASGSQPIRPRPRRRRVSKSRGGRLQRPGLRAFRSRREAASRSSGQEPPISRSEPVRTNPFSSRLISAGSQSVRGWAPIMRKSPSEFTFSSLRSSQFRSTNCSSQPSPPPPTISVPSRTSIEGVASICRTR